VSPANGIVTPTRLRRKLLSRRYRELASSRVLIILQGLDWVQQTREPAGIFSLGLRHVFTPIAKYSLHIVFRDEGKMKGLRIQTKPNVVCFDG
jgi:hypothetical protein